MSNNLKPAQAAFLDQYGNVQATKSITLDEKVACFTPGTIVGTQVGDRRVEHLRTGDKVVTRDNGVQEIVWIGKKSLSLRAGELRPDLQPILIRRGAIEPGFPTRDVLVSPNHRVLLSEKTSLDMFGLPEVLVEARHLAGLPGIEHWISARVEYVHFMFKNHEIIETSGCWSESFHPDRASTSALGTSQLTEIHAIFPELVTVDADQIMPVARPVVDRFEAELLIAS